MASLTAEAPDPKTFQAWEDAFKYPVPAVRRMEQQLRNDISGNRERLRMLVGTSYRELLSTADSIVHMDRQMRDAEEYLSNISQKCNTRLLDKAKSSTIQIREQSNVGRPAEYTNASHLAMLQRCPGVLVSLLRSGGSLQVASKVLVLSRHLHRKASEIAESTVFVDALRRKLGKLRSRLLSLIDRKLSKTEMDAASILDAMAAYSLATNSSCADVLRHFLHIRLNAISAIVQQDSSKGADILKALELWIKTVQDTQSLFPRQVSNALAKVKSDALLQDQAILKIQELDYDIHGPFIDDDIKQFTPYVRHDDLNISAAAELLSSWLPTALKAYVNGLKSILETIEDFQVILDLRKECLHQWVSSKVRMVGVTKSDCLDILRKAFQARLEECINEQATSIITVAQAVQNSLQSSDENQQSTRSLWASNFVDPEISLGARGLINGVRLKVHGGSARIERVLEIYTAWVTRMNTVRSAVLDLKSKKWTIEELDDEEEEIEEIEDIKYRLEKEDPTELDEKLQQALSTALELLQSGINDQQRAALDVANAVYLLRILRGIQLTAPNGIESRDMVFTFSIDLQRLVAKEVVERLLSMHRSAIKAATKQVKIPVRLLWDGAPESPIVPSPWPFQLLKSLHEDLAQIGPDIWTKHAVTELKDVLGVTLVNLLQETDDTNGTDHSLTSRMTGEDGVVSIASTNDEKDAKLQLLFDVQYLLAAISTQNSKESHPLENYSKALMGKAKLSDQQFSRITLAANEYCIGLKLIGKRNNRCTPTR